MTSPQTVEAEEAWARQVHEGAGGGAVEGECALCGSGNEAEPLGWVVRLVTGLPASFHWQLERPATLPGLSC